MNSLNSNPIEVTCAIILKNRKILATRRKKQHVRGGLWEFPGGKIEPLETPQECIVREITEELGLEITIVGKLTPIFHSYPDITIRLIPFLAFAETTVHFLADHDTARFFSFDDLKDLPWADADRKILDQLHTNKLFRKMLTLQ